VQSILSLLKPVKEHLKSKHGTLHPMLCFCFSSSIENYVISGISNVIFDIRNNISGVRNDILGVRNGFFGVCNDISGDLNDVFGLRNDIFGVRKRRRCMIPRPAWAGRPPKGGLNCGCKNNYLISGDKPPFRGVGRQKTKTVSIFQY
jgi:hypothetical protein